MREPRKASPAQTPRRSPNRLPTAASEQERWADAVRHLCRVDPHLRALIKRIGSCGLTPRPDRFGTLVNSGVTKGDSHQIWRTQRVQVTGASLRWFLRSSTGPNRAFEPQSL